MSNIRTLILSDLHHKWERAEKIIKHEAPDKIVFLGDYFDDFHDNFQIAAETAEWLLSSLSQKNRIHIFGNHDVNYAFPHRSYKCSGYEISKDYAISDILKEQDWRKLTLHTWVGSWLCSHAGVHTHFYEKYGEGKPFKKWLTKTCDEALKAAFSHQPAMPILRAGMSRGGKEVFGGIDWCDFSEFQPIMGVNQIFGHTPQSKPVALNKENTITVCLDVSHCDYYIIHNSKDDLNIDVKWYGDL